MNLRKYLIKLNNKLESNWMSVRLDQGVVSINAGWYVTEFLINGNLEHTPEIIIEDSQGLKNHRELIGFHAGRNRMLVYLPKGKLIAYSESIQFERLAKVSLLEGRARVLLICGRYLRDFFSLKVFLKMLLMQFQDNLELSSNLLHFYAPAKGGDIYLDNVRQWQKFKGFGKQLALFCGREKIAVVIQNESQRADLEALLIRPDAIILSGKALPDDINYVIALSQTERLRFPAILMLKREIKAFISKHGYKPKLVYTDHDYARVNGEIPDGLEPVFKPKPSKAYLHCFNYVGFACVYSIELARTVDSEQLFEDLVQYDLALQAFDNKKEVLHISEALINSTRSEPIITPAPLSSESPWANIDWQQNTDFNVLKANQKWQQHPSVDLIIPTRDGLTVLKPCIDSILTKTEYQNFTVIIVDNGSEKPETFDYFDLIKADPRVSVVSYPGEFNYSAINNFAASQGQSDYVALVNNDIEVIDGDWLTQMMVWAIQPNVGIVGAKLLFGNGLVQHAGVTIGMGNAAGHIHRLEEGDAPGYQLRCLATQNMMAVTAACLVTPRSLFESLGGLDEIKYKVAYNDIDYCLRVESLGHDVIWTPEAILYHHESVSRGDDMSDQHIERYFRELENLQSHWKTKGFVDKYYSKHLRISDEGVFPQMERHHEGPLHYLSNKNEST